MTYQPDWEAWNHAWGLLREMAPHLDDADDHATHLALDVLRSEGVRWSIMVEFHAWQTECLNRLRRDLYAEWRAGRAWNLPVPPWRNLGDAERHHTGAGAVGARVGDANACSPTSSTKTPLGLKSKGAKPMSKRHREQAYVWRASKRDQRAMEYARELYQWHLYKGHHEWAQWLQDEVDRLIAEAKQSHEDARTLAGDIILAVNFGGPGISTKRREGRPSRNPDGNSGVRVQHNSSNGGKEPDQ